MAPTWLSVIAHISLAAALASATAIGYDIVINRRGRPMTGSAFSRASRRSTCILTCRT
jgi:hypothetical protein